MIKAIIFDFFGVIEDGGEIDKSLLIYIKDDLKPKCKISILSNAVRDIRKWFTQDELSLFDEIVLSGETGMIKPRIEAYKFIANKLNANIAECVYVDDGTANCEGAIAAGMQAIQYKDINQLKIEIQKLLAV